MKEALLTLGIAVLAVGLIFGAAIVKWSWNANSGADEMLGPVKDRPILPYTPLSESERFHGIAIQIHNREKLNPSTDKDGKHDYGFKHAINEIADVGADTVTLSIAAYQENATSSSITTGAHNAPTPEELGELIQTAKARRLRVIVMPILLLDKPNGTEWRGRIIPPDADRWWADYREYMDKYAKAAEAAGADLFMVGSELNKMETSVTRWRTLIKHLRSRYGKLKFGYSANWDRYWKVAFWNESKPGAKDGLDYAGVTSYYDLASPPDTKLLEKWSTAKKDMERAEIFRDEAAKAKSEADVAKYEAIRARNEATMESLERSLNDKVPTVDEIAEAWETYAVEDGYGFRREHHYRDDLVAWQRTIGKPVIFTEVGYFSQIGTASAPWNYCLEGPASPQEQVNCYKAFLQVWKDRAATGDGIARRSPWDIVGGVTFWEWSKDSPKKDDYSPKGKPAELVMRDYFQSVHPEGPLSPTPPEPVPPADGKATTQPHAGSAKTQAATGP